MTNWRQKYEAIAVEIDAMRSDYRNRADAQERAVVGLTDEATMWRAHALALGRTLDVLTARTK